MSPTLTLLDGDRVTLDVPPAVRGVDKVIPYVSPAALQFASKQSALHRQQVTEVRKMLRTDLKLSSHLPSIHLRETSADIQSSLPEFEYP